jgi:hypothetical protein
LEHAPDIGDFVFARGRPASREQLWVRRGADGLEIRLLLDPALLSGARNLEEFLLLVEGVSHFLCVVFRARQGRPVSALELELQAEVDKFLAWLALWRRRRAGLPPRGLARRLIDRYRPDPNLAAEQRARYETAGALARRYAGSLEVRFVRRGRLHDMADELRRFYRMGMAEKRALIEKRAA